MSVADNRPPKRRALARIRGLGSRRWLLGLGFLAALAFTIFFGVRAVDLAHRSDNGTRPIQVWMSVPYVAYSYRMPPSVLFEALGLPPRLPSEAARRPIEEIANDQGRPVSALRSDLRPAIRRYQAEHSGAATPGPTSPNTTSSQLLSALLSYGLPVLFAVVLVSGVGVPLPTTLLLVAAGILVDQGELDFWEVAGAATLGIVAGDQIGYVIGRWGGHRLMDRARSWTDEERLDRAEAFVKRWGGVGVFLTRWLLTPLGSAVNLVSGITHYPWRYFVVFDVAGQAVWVAGYVLLGRFFSDRVQTMSDLFGNLIWAVVGLIFVVFLGRMLLRYRHAAPAP